MNLLWKVIFVARVYFEQAVINLVRVMVQRKSYIRSLFNNRKFLTKIAANLIWVIGLSFVSSTINAAPEAKAIKFWDDREPASQIKVNHAPWQALLDQYLDDQHPSGISRFNYDAVSDADRARLTEYIDYLLLLEPRQLNVDEQKAYWINIYNARVVQLVVDGLSEDQLESIREVRLGFRSRGPFERKSLELLEQKLSLNQIVNGILRPNFADPRIHFVLSRASLGGPDLSKTAFTASNLEELLVAAEKQFLSHSRAASVVDGKLVLSEIFKEYDTDFAPSADELLQYISPFVNSEVTDLIAAGQPDIEFEYDWGLNRP